MRNFILIAYFLFLITAVGYSQNYGSFASAMFMEVNGVTQFYNCDGHGGPNAIGSVQFAGSLGTFLQGSGLLRIRGAEIKTWKNSSANVCTPRLYYRIYPAGPPSGSFANFDINFYCNCSGSAFPVSCGGGPCSGNDQKWQTPGSGMGVNIDLTTYAPGSYELEVYYEIPGNNSGTSGCPDLVYDSNGGANYKMSFTIQAAPMPVTFNHISVKMSGKNHLLQWSTLSESNNSHFDVLASGNGKDFTFIGKVEGAGESGVLREYTFINSENTSFFRFYKIRQVDFDGRFSHSVVVHISPALLREGAFSVYPNPAGDYLNVYSSMEGMLEIRDFSGRLLKQFSVMSGENAISIGDIAPKGLILLQVRSENIISETCKVFVR